MININTKSKITNPKSYCAIAENVVSSDISLRYKFRYTAVQRSLCGRGDILDKISPTGDLAFKKVLASEENKDILAGLIGDFFNVEVEDLSIENPYSIDAYMELVKGEEITVLRNTLKDVAATFKTADFVSECQIKKTLYFSERSLLYPLERFCRNYNNAEHMQINKAGRLNRYSSMKPVYSLNILGYNHFDDDDALRIFELYDPERDKKFEKRLLRLGYFELKKPNIETQNQKHWYDYFNESAISSDAPEYIQKASKLIDFVNLTEEERTVAKSLERAQAEYDLEMYSSYIDGDTDRKTKTAKIMLSEGIQPELVAKCTELPLESVMAMCL